MNTLKEVPHLGAIDHAIEVLRASFDHPEADEAIAGLMLLREQTAWAHHTPKLMSEADAAADIAGTPRPGAEPVVAQQRFRHPQKTMPGWSPWQLCKPANRPAWEVDSEGYEVEYRAIYTTPQASQLLTGWHIDALCIEHCGDDADPKPLYTTPPQASQPAQDAAEPYAYAVYFPDEAREELVHRLDDLLDDLTNCTHSITPLYTHPLTDEQIMALVDAHTYDDHGYDIWTDGRGLARAIEAAHGIGAAQKGKP